MHDIVQEENVEDHFGRDGWPCQMWNKLAEWGRGSNKETLWRTSDHSATVPQLHHHYRM